MDQDTLKAHPYHGKDAVLSTKHGKERAVASPLMEAVGIRLCVPHNLDTDALGTFTGDIPRVGTVLEVALRKARLGMAATGLPIGLAREGSFGPHPGVGWIPADAETLLFVDDEMGIQVTESILSQTTNFAYETCVDADELDQWLHKVHFPSHGLFVRPNSGLQPNLLFKGLTSRMALREAVKRCAQASADGSAHVETDMRAHMNPTRLQVIAELAQRLGRRLATPCPECGTPGWGLVGVAPGLPCELCGLPTDGVREEIHGCPRCPLQQQRPRSDGKQTAYAGDCKWCNP